MEVILDQPKEPNGVAGLVRKKVEEWLQKHRQLTSLSSRSCRLLPKTSCMSTVSDAHPSTHTPDPCSSRM